MDFKLRQSKIDYFEARTFLKDGGKYSSLPYLKSTDKSTVRAHKSAVVKQEELFGTMWWPKDIDVIKRRNEQSKKAIKKGINCAPYFGHLIIPHPSGGRPSMYAFMPRLNGIHMDDKQTLEALLKLGQDGIEQYFDDYIRLRELGFYHESTIRENFKITDNAINMIDLNLMTAPQDRASVLMCAAYGLTNPLYSEPKLKKELIGLTQNALTKFKGNHIALGHLDGTIENNYWFDENLEKAGFKTTQCITF